MLTLNGWTNVLQPLDVLGESHQRVTPMDALVIINELNMPRYIGSGRRLPADPPADVRPPYFDVNCSGTVTPLDALLVINHLNGGPKPSGWEETSGGEGQGSGFISAAFCSPQLNEGNSLRTELTTTVQVPDANSAVRVTFRDPVFDGSSVGEMNDAFEIAVRDTSGNLLVIPFTPRLEAVANWSENTTSAVGPAVEMSQAQADRVATINLVGVPAGTEVQVSVRLLNNDSDTRSYVVVRGVEVVPATGANPAGATWEPEARRVSESVPWPIMQELTGSVVPKYARTTYTQDQSKLISEVSFENVSSGPVRSLIAVIDNLSDLSIRPLQPDGYTDDGRPYWRIATDRADGTLPSNAGSTLRRIEFASTMDRQFNFDWRIYGELRQGEVLFRSTPGDVIAAGNTYRYQAVASSSLGRAIRYSMIAGPSTASISEATGELVWSTNSADVGSHQVVIRATDAFGFTAQQSYSIAVQVHLENRPPIITSEPEVDALLASPFEVQTYATGQGPVAATLLPAPTGLKHVVTANQSANQLGRLSSGPFRLGENQPIGLGERPASELPGMFAGPTAIDVGIVPNTVGQFDRDVQQVLAEDVDGDGNPDAIALVNLRGNGNWNDSNDRGFLGVRYGDGDGAFREAWTVELPTVAGRIGQGATVHFADVTADGRKDLVVTTIATNRILVYANTGSGWFDTNPITSAVAGNYISLTQIEDMDRDGRLDLVLFENVQVQIGGRQAISIYRGDGTGQFTESQLITADTNNAGNGYVADVDGVNGPDIVRLNYSNVRIETYLNDGAGGYGARIDSETKLFYQPNSGSLFHPTSGYFEDFDGDGTIDALLIGQLGAGLLRGQGNGRFGNGTASGTVPMLPQTGEVFGISNMSGRGLDLNGDEHLDIVFGNPQSYSNLMVGLGRGDGTFDMSMYSTDFESDIGTGIIKDSQSMVYASIADFNRDGVVDVLLGNTLRGQRAGSVGLLLGDLPGTFRAPQSLRNFDFNGGSPTTFGMRESVTGDFNNDGVLDLVTGGSIGFGNGFYFTPGRGDGTFGKYSVVFGGVGSSNSLTTLDIDRDGNLDLAWIDGTQFRQAFGLGNGAFQALPSVPAPGGGGNFQHALQVDDFNGDGYPDLVHRLQTGNVETNFITRLVVLLYDPVGRRYNTLPDVNDYMTNWPRRGGYYWDESVGIGDLNGDGKKEFFAYSRSIESSNTPSKWVIFEKTGGPATDASTLFRKTVIETPTFIPHDRSIYSYVVADFDGDGIHDIAYSGNHVHTTVMFGNGDFTFRDPTNYYTHTYHVNRGDFNGDGVTDLVSLWGWGFLSYSMRPYQSILYGRGDGTFSELNGFTAVANINIAAVGDFNGDGRDDVAGTPDQQQGVAFVSRPQGVSDVASGDLNGDGTADLVSIISGLDRVKVNYQQWDQTFARQGDLFTDLFPVAVDLLDIDNDGLLDILTANQQGESLSMIRQTARGKFECDDIALPVRPSDLQLGDIDGDGIKDVVVLSEQDGTILVLRGGVGSLSLSLVLPLGFTPGDLAIGDVTGDGKPDVALSDPNGDRILLLPGRGDGTFASAISVLGVVSPEAVAVADMNRDGRMDLIVAQPNQGRVGFLYQRGAGRFTTPQWIAVGKNPTDITIDDANGDGAADVLVINRDDDTASLILNRFDPNRVWTYQPTAIDPDGDPVSFDLVDAPGGMLLDSATNTIYWAPLPEQIGSNGVVLEAFDGRGGATQQGFQVTVTAPVPKDAPRFTSMPVTSLAADAVYRYQPNVADQDPSALRFSLVKAPAGMTIDPITGGIEWDPRSNGLKLYANASPPNAPVSWQNYGYIEAADSPSLRPTSVTVEGWYYFEDPKSAQYENLLAKRASAGNNNVVSFGLEYYYGTLRAKVGTPASNNSLAVVTAPAPVEFQKWTHVAMTFDDTLKTLTLWINGENVGTAQSPEGISYNAQPLQSGRNFAILSRQRIWNRALSSSEIAAGMLADVPRDAAGLILQWNFQESRDATTIVDASYSDNHGYLVGTPDWHNFPSRQQGLSSTTSQEVILRVEDGRGGIAEQTFQVDIVAPFQRKVSGIVYHDIDNDGTRDVPPHANLIANHDFSSGFAGWETDFYALSPQVTTAWLGNSQVTVGSATNAIPLSGGYGGHTHGGPLDRMLIANGDSQNRVVWRQSIAWIPGQSYDFSFWAIRPSAYEAANLQVRVNGQPLGSSFTLSDVPEGTWKQFRQSLIASGDQGVFEIVSVGSTLPPNPGLTTVENSFAIDDLMLIPSSGSQRVIVPGTANPYLSGMPNGSTAYGSTAPQGSPPFVSVQAGQVLRIRATGSTKSDGFIGTQSPDGSAHNANGTVSNAVNGISSYAGPNHGSLLGVFLDDQAPSGQSPPSSLDFRANGNVPDGIQYTSISPQLRQLFFIGDGFAGNGVEQTISVPAGATRLFLANSSSLSWISNSGSFEVQVFTSTEEPVQAGRTVYLDSNRNQQFDPGEATSTTDAHGRYTLSAAGSFADVGLIGIAGQLQSVPPVAVSRVALNSVTPTANFGTRAVATGQTPVFLSEPIGEATAPGSYAYQVFAQSPLALPVTYELASAPAGMTIDRVSGLIQWHPLASQAGSHDILVKVFDTERQFALQRFSLNVAVNTPPIITSTVPQQSQLGAAWRYRLRAQDAEQSELTYRLVVAPAGMTISGTTGEIDLVPSAVGSFPFEVEVIDGVGGSARQSSAVTVVPTQANTLPQWVRGLPPSAIVQRNYAAQPVAVDSDAEPLMYSLVSGPAGLTVSSSGQVLWQPAENGTFSATIAVEDTRGGRVERTESIQVVSRAPRSTLQIESQPETAARTGLLYAYDVVAPGAVLFELVDAPVGMSIDPQFGSIRWLPTRDSLGVHRIQLRCSDWFGNTVNQEYSLAVRSSSIVPTVASAPPTEAVVGGTYLYAVRTSNPSGSPLQYELMVGPAGMQINSQSGMIAWTPSAAQVGPTTALLRVKDGLGNFSTQSYSIMVVAGEANRAPVIGSEVNLDGVVGQPYSYTLQATDPEGGALTYALRSAPQGFAIDATTGVVSWTPLVTDVGTVAVVLSAIDPQGGVAVQSFQIDVRPANRAPEFRSNPGLSVSQGGLYRYDVVAVDPDREPLTYELLESPAGMTIDALGRVRWQTQLDTPLGGRDVAIRVRDGLGATATQHYTFGVVKDTQAPRLTIVVSGEPVLYPWTTSPAIVRVLATDNVAVTNLELRVDGALVELAPDGTARVHFSAPGNGRLVATAMDAAGNFGTATGRVNMRSGEEDGSGNPAPEVSITGIGDGAAVSGIVDVIGSAVSPDFERYSLSYRRIGQTEFKLIYEGTTQVSGGSLGKWDTTLLENDSYVIKLEVHDKYGSFAAVEVNVSVTGNLKLGNFRLSFEDMTIPLAGIPITIVRTYDTLRADRDGDFGFGWRMEYRNTDLRTSLPKSGLEDLGIYTPFRAGTRVFLTLPGGIRQGFTFTPEYRVLPGFGQNNNLVVAFPRFTPDRGVTDILSAGSGALVANEYGELYMAGGVPWNPASPDVGGYTLTKSDGTTYRLDGATGRMTGVTDRNGNTLTFSEAGVTSSAGGVQLQFERDMQGRIAAIVDPQGHTVSYQYTTSGDLRSVTDREGNVTQYVYRDQPAHYLDRVLDPLGRTGVRAEYGPDGRLLRSLDANGQATSIAYDPANQLISTTNAAGQTSLAEYDEFGNVVRTVNELGQQTLFEYNGDNRLVRRVDPGQLVTAYAYDALGRETMREAPDGSRLYWTYHALGGVESSTNALGYTRRLDYDERGNVIASIDPLGRTAQFVYDSRGLLVSATDPAGYVTVTTYDVAGRRIGVHAPDGTHVSIMNDALGRPVSTTTTQTTPAGVLPVIVSARYNANGQVIETQDAEGNVTRFGYSATGQQVSAENSLGNRSVTEYDANGAVIRTVSVDGTVMERVLDELGRPTATTVNGLASTAVYDALGRTMRVTLPDATLATEVDNPFLAAVYDAAGRPTQMTRASGDVVTTDYDPSGRPVRRSDDAGSETVEYDRIGRVTARIDAMGRKTRYEYDQADQLVRIVAPDGGVTHHAYDERGLLRRVTDPLGRVTSVEYDSRQRITAVVDAMSQRTTYEYDELGNVTLQRDALGRATRHEYDRRGNRTALVRSDGSRETMEYDAANRLVRRTNAAGQTIEWHYNAKGQVVRKVSGGSSYDYAYDSRGLLVSVTDARGVTALVYDARQRLIRRIEPDGNFLEYSYDAAGRVTALATSSGTTTYAYGSDGQVATIAGPQGTTTSTYAADGRLATLEYPNGLTETRSYDAAGRLAHIATSDAQGVRSELRYEYDLAGRVVQIEDVGMATTTFAYDALDRLTSENRVPVRGNSQMIRYSYDAVGNRTARTTSAGVESYTYDANDQLRAVTGASDREYVYDAVGRLIQRIDAPGRRVEYAWDAEDRLTRAILVAPEGTTTIEYAYDAAGAMVSRSVNGAATRYLVDGNRDYWQVVEERDAQGATQARYAYGPAGRLSREGQGGVEYYHADRLGTVRFTSNANGVSSETLVTDAFGNTDAAGQQPYLFAGERRDPLTGLDDLRARRYDPATGRFLSRDASPGTLAVPVSQHDYLYANGSPTNATDPSGYFTLADLQAGSFLRNTLNMVGLQFGAGLLIRGLMGGGQLWDGPTASINSGNFHAAGGFFTTVPNPTKTKTSVMMAAFGEQWKAPNLFADKLQSFVGKKIPKGVAGQEMVLNILLLESLTLLNQVNLDVTFSSNTMNTPAFFGTGTSAFVGFTGAYASAGVGISTGLPGFAASWSLLGSAGKNAIGASAVIAGFSFGISVPDIGLSTSGSLGPSFVIGLSAGIPLPFFTQQPDDRPPMN